MERWQSPKSKPHTRIFLSAPPDTRSCESEETSWHSAGRRWPYSDRKNLSESAKNTFRVLSSSDTDSSFPSGVIRTDNTSSVI